MDEAPTCTGYDLEERVCGYLVFSYWRRGDETWTEADTFDLSDSAGLDRCLAALNAAAAE